MATTGRVTVRGMEITYQRAGAGPPLILMHGIGANSAAWRPQLAALSDTYDVIAWDAPGYGGSADPPGDWTMADYADALAGFLDELGIVRAHLLGQSWGGTLAQEFYGRYADRVQSLILSDTTIGGSAVRDDAERTLQGRLRAIETMTPAEFARVRAPQLLAPNPDPALLREMEGIVARIHPAGFRNAAIALARTDLRDVLPRIRVPTLVLCGELDNVTAPAVGTRLIGEIPGARRVIFAGAGHMSNMEQPDTYNTTVREFLGQVDDSKVM